MNTGTDRPRPLPPLLAHGCLVVVVAHVLMSTYAMGDPTSAIAIVTQAVFYLVLAVMLFDVQSGRVEFVACVALVGAATLGRSLFGAGEKTLQAAADGALVAGGTLVLIKAIRRMLHATVVTPALISAGVTVYLLAGVIWTIGFHALETLHPGSFVISGQAAQIDAGVLSYFSFVTLTTLGYGDISPATPVTRSLAALEAVFGQVILVVLLGRLVSLHIAHGHPRSGGEREADVADHTQQAADEMRSTNEQS